MKITTTAQTLKKGNAMKIKDDPRKSTYHLIQERLLQRSPCNFGEFRKAGHSVDFHHDNGAVYRLSLKTLKESRVVLAEPNPAGGVFDYLSILDTTRKELTLLEKEDLHNMYEQLNKDFARMNEIKDRLNEIGLCNQIGFSEEHNEEAKKLIKELNAFSRK